MMIDGMYNGILPDFLTGRIDWKYSSRSGQKRRRKLQRKGVKKKGWQ
jgi:hypothetical protein